MLARLASWASRGGGSASNSGGGDKARLVEKDGEASVTPPPLPPKSGAQQQQQRKPALPGLVLPAEDLSGLPTFSQLPESERRELEEHALFALRNGFSLLPLLPLTLAAAFLTLWYAAQPRCEELWRTGVQGLRTVQELSDAYRHSLLPPPPPPPPSPLPEEAWERGTPCKYPWFGQGGLCALVTGERGYPEDAERTCATHAAVRCTEALLAWAGLLQTSAFRETHACRSAAFGRLYPNASCGSDEGEGRGGEERDDDGHGSAGAGKEETAGSAGAGEEGTAGGSGGNGTVAGGAAGGTNGTHDGEQRGHQRPHGRRQGAPERQKRPFACCRWTP